MTESTPETETGWRELARKLHDEGSIPQRRAEVVALVATGHTHAETQEELGLTNRAEVANHVRRYRKEDLPPARWLAENAPEI